MARKKGFDYFDAFYQLSLITKEASLKLNDLMNDYSVTYLIEQVKMIHDIEKKGDETVTAIMYDLQHSFITPIDREDIIAITESLDDVLDSINRLTHVMVNLKIQELREETDKASAVIVEIMEELVRVTKEFSKFKHTKKMGTMVLKVSEIEEKADIIYSQQIQHLFETETNAIELIKWKEVYDKLEIIVNDAEKAATLMEKMRIKNI